MSTSRPTHYTKSPWREESRNFIVYHLKRNSQGFLGRYVELAGLSMEMYDLLSPDMADPSLFTAVDLSPSVVVARWFGRRCKDTCLLPPDGSTLKVQPNRPTLIYGEVFEVLHYLQMDERVPVTAINWDSTHTMNSSLWSGEAFNSVVGRSMEVLERREPHKMVMLLNFVADGHKGPLTAGAAEEMSERLIRAFGTWDRTKELTRRLTGTDWSPLRDHQFKGWLGPMHVTQSRTSSDQRSEGISPKRMGTIRLAITPTRVITENQNGN